MRHATVSVEDQRLIEAAVRSEWGKEALPFNKRFPDLASIAADCRPLGVALGLRKAEGDSCR